MEEWLCGQYGGNEEGETGDSDEEKIEWNVVVKAALKACPRKLVKYQSLSIIFWTNIYRQCKAKKSFA